MDVRLVLDRAAERDRQRKGGEQRPRTGVAAVGRIAALIKAAQPEISNRQIAKLPFRPKGR